ncbi:hypothetical protein BDZ97DRAFT_1919846 [Flammula alnicola]|nr:hypothetical protein BDZ97DRAFT_1919846 [Flammula alnicola]
MEKETLIKVDATAVEGYEMIEHSSVKNSPYKVPHPSHRYASPSAPWPWVDLQDGEGCVIIDDFKSPSRSTMAFSEIDREQLEKTMDPIPPLCDHKYCAGCWKEYPQSRFPNWTKRQVQKSKIADAIANVYCDGSKPCICIRLTWWNHSSKGWRRKGYWKRMIEEKRPDGLRVRAMFIENLSGPVLQMFGVKYNIEPFFWSSSLNWIPSRFQGEIQPGIGDHITITLTFLRSIASQPSFEFGHKTLYNDPALNDTEDDIIVSLKIDTEAPLKLSKKRELVSDLLAVHLIRNVNGSTIISYHPNNDISSARFLHERIRFAGQSVYWQSIFKKSADPTFILLTFIWHAMYGWDEALEHLYEHICTLETQVTQVATKSAALTHELHVIRAHQLHYSSLLEDINKHVKFIRDTPSPLLDGLSPEDYNFSRMIMDRECTNLLTETKRLQDELYNQEQRLKNFNALVYSTVNIQDSRAMHQMTRASVRDSAGAFSFLFFRYMGLSNSDTLSKMKQIAYLTMVFLPASFVSGVFGMNVREINPGTLGTLPHYIAVSISLTLLSAWVIIAFQSKYLFSTNRSFIARLAWPVHIIIEWLKTLRSAKKREKSDSDVV